ncbi:hypothetical protein [Paenibacillus beijingensis]|uniref:Uncharacterized protein n=1 Tax=Paenibacillus beijingensis TaxID=1126833 RepID=A0A0D5NEP6_9BACL|nr:hypothetical protein [Paenibacillus beijingensis]AJY73859.1 hypothetical protein VN24_03565 [Paenibacillus beijingensis]
MTDQSPLIAYIGTTPNIGTTAAAFATAYRLGEESGKPVGFLCLNLKSAKLHRYLGVDTPGCTLDGLRPELRAGSLTPQKLIRACHTVRGLPGVHVLFGNMMRDQAEFFTPEEAEHLLDVAERTFSLTLLDVGAYWDNAATICGLRRAGSRVLVTTGALSHFQEDGNRWIKQVSPLFGVQPEQYEMVVIQPPWKIGGYSMKEIGKETGIAPIGEMQLNETFFSLLDSGRYEDWLRGDEQGKKAMKETSQKLMGRYGLQRKTVMTVQPWYRKLLTHRGGVGL